MDFFNTLLATVDEADTAAANAVSTASDVVSGGDVPGGFLASCMSSPWSIFIFYAVIIGFFYLVFLRPQKKRRQQEEAMRKNIELGDNIVTIGGICGKIISIREDDTLVIETGADRSKIKIKSWAIQQNETVHDVVASEDTKKKFSLFGKRKGEAE